MHLTLDYDNMYSDFRPDTRVGTNEQYGEPSKHIVSIGNHEKGIQPPHNEMNCVLCIKES